MSISSTSPSVLVVGACGVDYIASVAAYPRPDDKIRTEQLTIVGGGNAANTATALARLGVSVGLVSQVGDDAAAGVILGELAAEGVDTSLVSVLPQSSSAFTYVIVDGATSTRTCLHTPVRADLSVAVAQQVFSRAAAAAADVPAWIHFDSRHTEASVALAGLARERGVCASLDMEKLRPHAEALLPLCPVLFTNEHFPALHARHTGHTSASGSLEEDMAHLLESCHARVVVSTLGARGSVLLRRAHDTLEDLRPHVTTHGRNLLRHTVLPLHAEETTLTVGTSQYSLQRCTCWPLAAGDIVDTTGAGDSFIGGFLFAFLSLYDTLDSLRIATLVAAEKLKGLGSRTTLPRLADLERCIVPYKQAGDI